MIGSSTATVVPMPAALLIWISPPMARTIERLIVRPNPVPVPPLGRRE